VFDINSYIVQILTIIGINSISALGLHVVTGLTGQFSLAQAAFSGIGAYASALISLKTGLPFPIALIVGIIAASLIAVIVGWPSLRLRGDYLAITTLGFGEVFRVFLLNFEFTNKALGLHGIPRETNLFITYFLLAICIIITWIMTKSRIGRNMITISNDEAVAESFGIKLSKYKLLAFTISGAFAGLSGGLYAHNILYVNPSDFGFMKSVDVLLYIIIGGLGSLPGAILGSALLTGLPELLRGFSQYRMLVYGCVLIFLMIYRPQGIMGKSDSSISKLIRKKLHHIDKTSKGGAV